MRKSKKILISITISVLAILLAATGVVVSFNMINQNNLGQKNDRRDNDSSIVYIDGKPYTLKPNVESVLIIGTDKFADDNDSDSEYRNDEQNDFNLLLVIDNESKIYTPLFINRDTMMDIQVSSLDGQDAGTENKQLALAHTYGSGKSDSCINVSQAISDFLLGTKIDHYFAVSLDAIMPLNSAVGGVTLEVLDDMSSFDEHMIKGAELTLTDKQAGYYVRNRYGLEDSSNLSRMQRQKQYIEEWVKLAKTKANDSSKFVDNTIIKINDYLTTDMSLSYMSSLAEKLSQYKQNDFVELKGTTSVVNNHIQFTADDAYLKKIVLDEFYISAKDDVE